jgi:putative alpha-1,2-mannosidase
MMKSSFSRRSLIKGIATTALVPAHLPVAAAPVEKQKKKPVDYVDPNIGGIGQLLSSTNPHVMMPFGMMAIWPMTTPGISDRYLADKIYGFPAGGLTMMPMAGPAELDPAQYASPYDHDLEHATPYYYAATLEKYNLEVEYTASAHAAYCRFTFPENLPAHVLYSMPQGAEINLLNTTSLNGSSRRGAGFNARGGGKGGFFYAEFSKPVAASKALTGLQLPQGRPQTGGSGRSTTSGVRSSRK